MNIQKVIEKIESWKEKQTDSYVKDAYLQCLSIIKEEIEQSCEKIEIISSEKCAKALFDEEQGGRFPPKFSNFVLYGKEHVSWEDINDERFVTVCSDQYRNKAAIVLDAAGVKYE